MEMVGRYATMANSVSRRPNDENGNPETMPYRWQNNNKLVNDQLTA